MRNIFLIFFISLPLFICVTSCSEDALFDCVKKTGKILEKEVELEAFHAIKLHDGINLTISEGPEQKVVVKAGENIIPSIKFNVVDGQLEIFDENRCNWVRDFNEMEVQITTHQLTSLVHSGYGQIQSKGALQFVDLYVEALDGNGDINLDLAVNGGVNLVSNSSSNISFSGSVINLSIAFYSNQGKFLGRNLQADSIGIHHDGYNTIEVYPKELLDVNILASGNVVYFNEPAELVANIKGSGNLIKQ